MRVWHSSIMTFVQGSHKEFDKINKWMSILEKNYGFEIVVDECDEYELSYTLICPCETQKERQISCQLAKKLI